MAAVNCILHRFNDNFFSYGHRGDNPSGINLFDQLSQSSPSVNNEEETAQIEVELEGRLVVCSGDDADEIRLVNNGDYVQLDISEINGFSYFSGMKLRVKGVQADVGSRKMKVKSIVPFTSLPLAKLQDDSDFLRVCMAFGPFVNNSSHDQLDYFLEKVMNLNASAVILSGPFYNPAEQEKAVERTNIVLQKISDKVNGSKTKVIVLPNASNDILSTNTFPTPALRPELLGITGLSRNIEFVPDPAVFSLNGVSFIVTSSDPLKNLAKKEKYCGEVSQSKDRMSILCEHLLDQRLACPASFGQQSSVVHNIEDEHFTERPHFFVVPSNLAQIKKNVQNTMFLNPGKFLFGQKVRYSKIDVNIKRARTNQADSIGLEAFSSVENRSEVFAEEKMET
ncbi:unnamed protein product [Bursaphelenchus okinawaensis]|uniref:DNA polymerase alpha subunit B n=1 Tax=Bursaphelenchus okinawaensis TaxID=465554 RepID=A0A811K2G5_9BILA|nr:unnamed protein product [Bursaphelenchus okinawaensis]CAG9089816.1 unnamed protein product [Bursaphelenchus okinawaensis]